MPRSNKPGIKAASVSARRRRVVTTLVVGGQTASQVAKSEDVTTRTIQSDLASPEAQFHIRRLTQASDVQLRRIWQTSLDQIEVALQAQAVTQAGVVADYRSRLGAVQQTLQIVRISSEAADRFTAAGTGRPGVTWTQFQALLTEETTT